MGPRPFGIGQGHALDSVLGDGLDRLVIRWHRRRLARLGWSHALQPQGSGLWATDGNPVRAGNDLRVHIDGSEALPRIAAAIRGARSNVLMAGWHASPDFVLERPRGQPLRDLLAEVAERVPVRLIMWAGPPAPAFRPTRAMARRARDGFVLDSGTRVALDARERTMHCHHEKIVVVDDQVAFVGGIDLTALGGDRFDSSSHLPHNPLGWHDAALEVRGPVVADVAAHVANRWSEVTGERLDPPVRQPPAGNTEVQLVRTVPENTYRFSPRGDFSALETYVRALRSARHLVHLENQFLWSTEIVNILCGLLQQPPHDDFRMMLVLPARPNNGADTTRGQLGRLLEADNGGDRLLATTLSAVDADRSGPMYVHAKIGIVDDRWLALGSVNLNEHSLFNDTEAALVTCDEPLARATRLQLWAEHLRCSVEQVAGDPTDVIDRLIRPTAETQLQRYQANQPPTHRLRLLENVSRRGERLVGPMRGLLVDG